MPSPYLHIGTILLGWCLFLWTGSHSTSLWPLFFYGLISIVWLVWVLKKHKSDHLSLWVIFTFWILTRLPTFWCTPYFEDDYYRYLWDGWVTLHGGNALVISPNEVRLGKMAPDWPSTWSQEQVQERRQDIEWRQSLLSESARDELLSKINFSESPSIYGPFGQVFLALSALPIKIDMIILKGEYHISWAIGYLRFGLLALDALLCWLFYIACQRNRQLLMSLVACPLLMKELGNSLHIDILPSCMVLGAFLLSRIKSNTPRMAFLVGVTLALACCVKAYVLVLLPWFWLTTSHKGSVSLGTFTTFIVMYLPWCWSGGTEIWTGTQYFSTLWSMNDFFTALLREWFYHGHDLGRQSRFLYPIGEVWVSGVQSLSRQLGVLCFASLCAFFWVKRWFWLRQNPNSQKTIPLDHILAWTLLGVVWFAPVQNPWYLLWGLPFFLLSSHNMGIWIIALSPAYLFNFYFKATAHLFHPFQWWVIFPHVILLVVGWMSVNRHRINP